MAFDMVASSACLGDHIFHIFCFCSIHFIEWNCGLVQCSTLPTQSAEHTCRFRCWLNACHFDVAAALCAVWWTYPYCKYILHAMLIFRTRYMYAPIGCLLARARYVDRLNLQQFSTLFCMHRVRNSSLCQQCVCVCTLRAKIFSSFVRVYYFMLSLVLAAACAAVHVLLFINQLCY